MDNLEILVERARKNGMVTAMILANKKCREKGIDPIFSVEEMDNALSHIENPSIEDRAYASVTDATMNAVFGE